MHFKSFDEFWNFYVNQRTKATTRRRHFYATGFAIMFFVSTIAIRWWLLFVAPIFGYGLTWYSDFFIKGNTPTSFAHPMWSFLCEYKMFFLMLTGRMDGEIKSLGKRPMLQEDEEEEERGAPKEAGMNKVSLCSQEDEYMMWRKYFDAKQETGLFWGSRRDGYVETFDIIICPSGTTGSTSLHF